MTLSPLDVYDALATRRTRPALTWYAASGRVELSGKVAAQSAAKVAGYLLDDVWMEPGTSVDIRLPAGPRALTWVLGAALAGARLDISGPDAALSGADIIMTANPSAAALAALAASDAGCIIAVETHPLAFSWMGASLLTNVRDGAAEAMGAPDALMDRGAWAHWDWPSQAPGTTPSSHTHAGQPTPEDSASTDATVLVAPTITVAAQALLSYAGG